mmetsp:Transcript_29276/g.97290  ORF Transcript_29276/g.97290 Transcript_29276/m.97290 type:complete len:207 (-) Transcript_29276:7469-8089(-)
MRSRLASRPMQWPICARRSPRCVSPLQRVRSAANRRRRQHGKLSPSLMPIWMLHAKQRRSCRPRSSNLSRSCRRILRSHELSRCNHPRCSVNFLVVGLRFRRRVSSQRISKHGFAMRKLGRSLSWIQRSMRYAGTPWMRPPRAMPWLLTCVTRLPSLWTRQPIKSVHCLMNCGHRRPELLMPKQRGLRWHSNCRPYTEVLASGGLR